MKEPEDLARIGYVLEKPDLCEYAPTASGEIDYSAEFRDKSDNPPPLIRFKRRIDGNYAVVVAAAENTRKKLWVVSAYMETNKNALTKASNKEFTSPDPTSETSPASRASNDTVPHSTDNGKQFSIRQDSTGKQLTPEQREYFKDSKVVDENGNLLVVYHGTPSGGFTVFRPASYFSANKEYADVYQNPSASSISYGKTQDNPQTYKGYLNITKPFDTRIPEIRKIFEEQYYRKWGTGAPLNERTGLPDWTDGMDLQEFIEENGLDFDGLILDEGGVPDGNGGVEYRGLSYVPLNGGNQFKDINNLNPTGNPDMQFSMREDAPQKVQDALDNIYYRSVVPLTVNMPSIITGQKNTKDLPMVMKASHIRENIFTQEEARQKGLKVDQHTHYHGLGKGLFLDVIRDLDDIDLAYRGTKKAANSERRENYFLLVSKHKHNGDSIVVPVYLNETGQINNQFIRVNKIATVFGKENIEDYFSRELGYRNLVRVKKKTSSPVNGTALIAGGYKNDVSGKNISQDSQNGKQNSFRGSETILDHAETAADTAGLYKQVEKLQKQVDNLKGEFKKKYGYKASIPAAHKAVKNLINA